MDYINLVFQLFSAGILVYLILRLFDLELRVDKLEQKKNITISLSPPPKASHSHQHNDDIPPLIVGASGEYRQEDDVGGEDEEEAHPDLLQTEEAIDNRLLIEPQQLDTTEEASARLRKLTVAQLTDIASEKKIPVVVGKKKLNKDALIKAIMTSTPQDE